MVVHIMAKERTSIKYEFESVPRSITVLAAPIIKTNMVRAIANGNLLDSGT